MRVVLTGTFCSLNKGDAAMQLSAAAAWPDAEVTVLTPYSQVDAPTYGTCRVVKTNRRDSLRAGAQLGRVALWRLLERIAGVDVGVLRRGEEIEAYRSADVVIDLSGDTITEDYGVACVVSHLVPVLLATLLGRPVMLCAQTIGPFRMTRGLVRFVLSRASLITTRERLSFDEVAGLRLHGPRIQLTGDVAFLLEPAASERVDAIMAAEGMQTLNGLYLGVAASGLPGLRGGPGKVELVELFAAVIDEFVETTGADVMLVAHVTGPGPDRDDREVHRAIRARMRHASRAHVVAGDYRPEELRGLIGRCAAFMGLRMHANISALAMNVPTLAIAYSRKSHGIMAAAGQRDWVRDIGDCDRAVLGAALEELWRVRATIRSDLIGRQAELRARSQENFRAADRLLQLAGEQA